MSSFTYLNELVKIFFSGIMLVHDLTNRKSHQNLRKWLSEILNRDSKSQTDEWVEFEN